MTTEELLRPGDRPRLAADAGSASWDLAIGRALADPGQPGIVFQPIVDLRKGVTAGYEALARFTPGPPGPLGPASVVRPPLRLAPPVAGPDRWFLEADRRGVAAEFEARVLRAALRARDTLPPGCFLAVNVLPHLLTSPEVTAAWMGADLAGMVLELSELVSVDALPGLPGVVRDLRSRGGHVALDDVGSAYAGLARIAALRPDLVKLDRELVAYADHDDVRLALIELVGNFATRVRAGMVAEGIERDEELAALIALGIPFGQGWLLGRPDVRWQPLDPALGERIRLLAGAVRQIGVVVGLLERPPITCVDDLPRTCPGSELPAGLRLVPEPVGIGAPRREGERSTAPSRTPVDGAREGGRVPGTVEPARTNPRGLPEMIIVDRRNRAVALQVSRGHPDGVRSHRVPVSLFARADEHIAEVARKAMTRPATSRFDPVVVVSEIGWPMGVVRVERLLLRLAEICRPDR
ncbi:MAG: EAL domain-containing protein [Frankia sp.]